MKSLLKTYIEPMLDANVDYLVLGCTHYPYLIPQLLELLPKHIKIIDSGEAVARQTQTVLRQHQLLNNTTNKPTLKFYSNGSPEVLQSLLGNNHHVAYLDF
jgi:glutamate racemase